MEDNLETLRSKIDELDGEILNLLIKRFQIVKLIANCKAKTGQAIFQPERAKAVTEKAKQIAEENGIKPRHFEEIYGTLLKESCKYQSEMKK